MTRLEAIESVDLLCRIAEHRRGSLTPEQRDAIGEAAARVRAQVTDGVTPVLLVALVGASGAGKSTLINALARTPIARVGATRPTTTRATVYHHESVAGGGLPHELADEAVLVAHSRDRLRTKAIIDTPDLDTYVTTNRETTRGILRAAGLVVYVFSPERYMEERVWGVIAQERAFSSCAFVLNKCDQVSQDERDAITAEVRDRFRALGVESVPFFATAATEPGDAGVERLLAHFEQTLRDSDSARLVRHQHESAATTLERAALPLLCPGLDEGVAAARDAAREAAEREVERTIIEHAVEIAAAEDRARAAAAVARTARFTGPMRAWLGVWDAARFALPELARRSLGHAPIGRGESFSGIVGPATRRAADAAQEALFRAGLPIDAWINCVPTDAESRAANAAAGAMERVTDQVGPLRRARERAAIALGSALGLLLPALLVGFGGYLLVRDLIEGRYDGMPLFGHLAVLTLLVFIALHALVALIMPAPPRLRGRAGASLLASSACAPIDAAITDYAREISASSREARNAVHAVREALLREHA